MLFEPYKYNVFLDYSQVCWKKSLEKNSTFYLLKISVCIFHEDSGDEMSSDSLGPALHEEGSSDEEARMHGHFARGRTREEEQGNSAISHLRDSFVPTDAEGERDLWTDEPEQLSETSMVTCFYIPTYFLVL